MQICAECKSFDQIKRICTDIKKARVFKDEQRIAALKRDSRLPENPNTCGWYK